MALILDGKRGSGVTRLSEKAAFTGPQDLISGAVEDLFEIIGGPIEVLALVGEITEAVSANSCDLKLELIPNEFYPKNGRVNLTPYGRNINQGSNDPIGVGQVGWTGGTASKTQNQTDLDGKPNSAWTLTDDSSSGAEWLEQTLKISAKNDSFLWSFYVLKDADVSRFPEFYMVFTGGTEKVYAVQLNTQTGATNERIDEVTGTVTVDDAGLWWRISLYGTDTGSNTELYIRHYPAFTDVLGNPQNANIQGSIIVDAFQLERNQATATDFIFTQGIGAAELDADVLQTGTPYRILTTEVDYFYTGCAVNDYFIAETHLAIDENNTVQEYGEGEGASPLCAVIDINGFVINSWISIDGVAANPAVQAIPGTALPLGIGMDVPLVLQPGNIKMDLSNYDPTTGTIDWYLRYLPLKEKVYVIGKA